MNIVLFAHPTFLNHQSMPRYAQMLADGMRARGHKVAIWSPKGRFAQLPVPKVFRKWLGYIDQYVVFPTEIRRRVRHCPAATIFAFTDQALGPWIPLLSGQHRVVHCHDFLAQRSAIGEITENRTSWTGRQYQAYIHRGYRQGKHFISVSQRTREDLHRFLLTPPIRSEVVYNGLNQVFEPQNVAQARQTLESNTGVQVSAGYLLHVGGNHFYKNRPGVIELYDAWRTSSNTILPLVMIGEAPNNLLTSVYEKSLYKQDIYLLSGISDALVRAAYAGATLFLFPSLAEGFGWPIAEAMASGCPVITTDEAPMTEVAGTAGFLIPRRPSDVAEVENWAGEVARTVEKVVNLSESERQAVVYAGLVNAKRFNTDEALNHIEKIYKEILEASV